MENKKIILIITLCLLYVSIGFTQSVPNWVDADIRAMQYPSKKYLVGYASGNINANEDMGKATERIKNAAQSNLLESIRVNMQSNTRSAITAENVNGQYYENEAFLNATEKKSVAEIVGMKTESYYDKKSKTVYAFAYAKRDEVTAYHKNLLMSNLSQAEGLLNTAHKLYEQQDLAAARKQCDMALALIEKINESQSLLLAVNSQISETDIQQNRSKNLYKDLLQLQSQLDPKYEILENLQNNLSQKLIQVESFLQTSKNLVSDGEKAKARSQCELAKKILNDVRQIQDSMRIIEPAVSAATLQQSRTENLHNEITLLSAQLAQAVMVYVESSEDVFGKQVNIVANKLKSQLATNGCSFINDKSKADFKLTITVEAKQTESINFKLTQFVSCVANISLDIYDLHKQKSVFSDDISEKGSATTEEKAAYKAMEKAVDNLMEKILKVITLGPSSEENINIPNTNFWVSAADESGFFSWEHAQMVCSLKGEGWRLPTIEELTKMSFVQIEIKNLNGRNGNFKYWSSDEKNKTNAYYFDVKKREKGRDKKSDTDKCVRCVKSK